MKKAKVKLVQNNQTVLLKKLLRQKIQQTSSAESNSSDDDNPDSQTVSTGSIIDGNADASTLKESKSENQQTVIVSSNAIDENGQVTSDPANTTMMAGQDNNNVTIQIDNPQVDENNSITINFPDAGSSKAYKLNTTTGESDLSGDSTGHWHLNTTDSSIVATWIPASSTL